MQYPVTARTGGHGSAVFQSTFTVLPPPDQNLRPSPYRDMLVSLPTFWRENPLRSQALINSVSSVKPNIWVTYDPGMDAAKTRIPPFIGTAVQIASVAPDRVTFTRPLTPLEKYDYIPFRALKIDDEIATVIRWTTFGQQFADGDTSVLVARGQFGTAAIDHGVGTAVQLSQNNLLSYLNVPLGTSDGNSYLFTWDVRYDSSYLGTDILVPSLSRKEFQLTAGRGGVWLEARTRPDGIDGMLGTLGKALIDRTTTIAIVDGRYYNDVSATFTGLTSTDSLAPQVNRFFIRANTWIRYWWFIDQRADDFDVCTLWIADETTGPVQIFEALRLNARATSAGIRTIATWWFEQNTSYDLYRGTMRDLESWGKNFVALRGLTMADVPALLLTPSQMP